MEPFLAEISTPDNLLLLEMLIRMTLTFSNIMADAKGALKSEIMNMNSKIYAFDHSQPNRDQFPNIRD